MQESSLKYIGRSAGFRFGGIIIQNVIFLLTALIINKLLGSSGLGDYFLVVTLMNIMGFASTLGMKFGTVRYVALYRARKDREGIMGTIAASALISFVVGIGAGILIFFTSPLIADRVFHLPSLRLPLKIMSAALPFLSLGTVIISALQGFKKIPSKVWLENIIQPASALILIGGILFFYRSFPAATAAWTSAMILSALAAGVFLLKEPEFSRVGFRCRLAVRELLSFSLPLMAVGFLYYIFTRMDILMIGYFKSSGDVGVYAIAARLAFLIALPLEAVNVIFEPTIAENTRNDRYGRPAIIYRRITPWILASGFTIFAVILIVTPPLMAMFGRDFQSGRMVLLILGMGQLINLGVGSAGSLLSMSGYPRVNLLNTVSIVVLNFVLNCLLIPQFGIYGAAAATALSIGLINVMRLIEVKILLDMHPFSVKYLRILFPVAAGALAIFLADRFLPGFKIPAVRALVLIAIFSLVYFPVLMLIGLDAGERNIFNKIIKSRLAGLYEKIQS